METSAAVPDHVDPPAPASIDRLDDESARHLADAMVVWWVRRNRFALVGVLAPVGGCSAVSAAAPDLMGVAVALAAVVLVALLPAEIVLGGIARRALRDEAALLGFDAAAQKLVVRAFDRSRRRFLPRFTRAQKRTSALRELGALRRRR